MQLQDIMTAGIHAVDRSTPVQDAASSMREHHVGMVPVCDEGVVVGVITDRDIALRVTAESRDPATPVGDVMTGDVACVYFDEPLETAARVMEERRIRRLLVMDREQRIRGMVSLGDVAGRAHQPDLAGKVIEHLFERPETAAQHS